MAKRTSGAGKGRPAERVPAASARATARAARTQHVFVDNEPDIPRWVAPVVFTIITVLLFPEVFFGGNTMFGHDTLGLSYFARDFYTQFVRTYHAFPLWDPMVLGGLPFLEGMHGDIFYPPSLALFFLDAKHMWAAKMVLHVFLAGIFAYVWLRRGMNLRRGPALFGGIVYMMGADLVSLVTPGGDGKLFVSALAPLVFWLAERAARGKRASDFAAFALGITLIVLTSHMQSAYFCVWGVTFYFFYRVYSMWRVDHNGRAAARLIGMFALSGVLAMGAAAIQFMPPLQYLQKHSLRVDARSNPNVAFEEATSFALNPEEAMSLVVPEFVGSSGEGTYWGRNLIKLNHEYAGVIALILLPILFFRRRTPRAWFFVGLALFAVTFALGANTPLFKLYIHIPGVKLFRAPSIIIFLYGLSVATLGAMAVQRLVEWRGTESDEARFVSLYLWVVVGVTGLLAFAAASGGFVRMWRTTIFEPGQLDASRAEALTANTPHIQAGFWILFILAVVIAAWWMGLRRGTYGARIAVAAIALLAAIDQYRVSRPFVKSTAEENTRMGNIPFFGNDEVLTYLQNQAKDPKHVFRVANFVDPQSQRFAYQFSRNNIAIHGIETVGGLHGNEMGRYVQLLDQQGLFVFQNLQLMNLANAEYLVFPGRIKPIEPLEQVAVSEMAALYRNKSVWPRAFLVGQIQVIDDTGALEKMQRGEVDLRQTAIVGERAPELETLQPNPQGTVEWVERSPNRLRMRVTSDKPALMVLTDNYYPAWKATVAGKAAQVYRTDYTFRGVLVPAGTSDVEMHYSTSHLATYAIMSIVLMLLLAATAVSGLIRRPVAVHEREADAVA